MTPVSIVIVGAGSRGTGYATYASAYPERARIVGVAEPRDFYRRRVAEMHGIPPENVVTDWRDLAAREKLADAAIVATQDAMHAEPAIAFAGKGYHLLLEKPMAPTEAGCRAIVEAAVRNRIIFAVCHVLRYTRYTQMLKEIIESGVIGEVTGIQRLEPVGYWHQAHSYVRGNWGNEERSSPMLLAKSCHDLDWIRHLMGARCNAVSSFGSLRHFRKTEQPPGAASRCLECGVEPTCPYSAKKIYLGRIREGRTGWPVNILTPDVTERGVMEALRAGPYGQCVYECDNDVVDNQVVNMLFDGGKTATFTMTAFTQSGHRKTHLFGTLGEIYGDGRHIHIFDFLTDKTKVIDAEATAGTVLSGHGGGDHGLMSSFVAAVADNDPTKILSGPEESLETHLMVFAAERARRENRVVTL